MSGSRKSLTSENVARTVNVVKRFGPMTTKSVGAVLGIDASTALDLLKMSDEVKMVGVVYGEQTWNHVSKL